MGAEVERQLADIDAELSRRGHPPQNDRVAEIEAELARRQAGTAEKPDHLRNMAPYYLGPLGPVRAIRDASHALDSAAYKAGGYATDVATNVGASPEVAAGVGTAANLGVQAAPMALGGEALKLASPAFQAGARNLMGQALKPSKVQWDKGQGAAAVDTMLNEGVNVTKGGVEKLRGKIDVLNDEIADTIAKSTGVVDAENVALRLKDVFKKFKEQVAPQDDLAIIRQKLEQFMDNPNFAKDMQIPVQLAQKIKQGTYRVLGGKSYGELKSAGTEAEKALARGLKEEIAIAEPSVAPKNAEESKLINALKIAENRVNMSTNKNTLGLGAAFAHSPTQLLVWLADRSPAAASMLARAMHSGAERIPQAAGQGLGAVVGSQYLGRRERRLQDEMDK